MERVNIIYSFTLTKANPFCLLLFFCILVTITRKLTSTSTTLKTLDPIFGESCAVDILGEDDSLEFEDGIANGVYDMDGDICYDVVGKSGWSLTNFTFQENLTVPCEFGEDESIQTVFVQTCFSWRTPGKFAIKCS